MLLQKQFFQQPTHPLFKLYKNKQNIKNTKHHTFNQYEDLKNTYHLKNYSLYQFNTQLDYVFQRHIQNTSYQINLFLNKYKPYNQKLIQQKKINLQIKKIATNKFYCGQINSDNQNIQGYGIIYCDNGILYQGYFKQNMRHGVGLYVNSDRSWYYGNFQSDKKHGFGLLVTKNYTYQGNFLNGQKNGIASFISKQVSYHGEWKLNIIHGYGCLETQQSKYQGYFKNFFKNGKGQQRFKNGDQYKGNYLNGKFQGEGEYKWAYDKNKFKGYFKNGQRYGKGQWQNLKGDHYYGNYKRNLKQQYGQFYWKSGNFYKGNFLQDQREGYGEFFWSNGSVYKGQWHKGVQNGKGELYIYGQNTLTGIFQNNVLISSQISPHQKVKHFSLMEFDLKHDKIQYLKQDGTFTQRMAFSKQQFQNETHEKRPKFDIVNKKLNPIIQKVNTKKKSNISPSSNQHDHQHNKISSRSRHHHRFCKACATKYKNKQIKTSSLLKKNRVVRNDDTLLKQNATQYLRYKF